MHQGQGGGADGAMAQAIDAGHTEGAGLARLQAVEEALAQQAQANTRVETAIANMETKLKAQQKSHAERLQSVDLVVGQLRATSEAGGAAGELRKDAGGRGKVEDPEHEETGGGREAAGRQDEEDGGTDEERGRKDEGRRTTERRTTEEGRGRGEEG